MLIGETAVNNNKYAHLFLKAYQIVSTGKQIYDKIGEGNSGLAPDVEKLTAEISDILVN
jgi:hypothetical protein